MGATLDYGLLLGVLWGDEDYGSNPVFSQITLASNIVNGSNPPYTIVDFLNFFPGFFGPVTIASVTFTNGSNQAILQTAISGLSSGVLIVNFAIPDGTTVVSVSVDGLTLTLSNNAIASSISQSYLYLSAPIPLIVIQTYINLASACVNYNRYFDSWQLCIGLFVAHYLTMWATANQIGATSSVAQIAATGLAIGIKTSKHAGNVGMGIRPLDDLIGWGTFQLTLYGQQFASIAKVLGSGNMLVW
jgi:hypothetical protein